MRFVPTAALGKHSDERVVNSNNNSCTWDNDLFPDTFS